MLHDKLVLPRAPRVPRGGSSLNIHTENAVRLVATDPGDRDEGSLLSHGLRSVRMSV